MDELMKMQKFLKETHTQKSLSDCSVSESDCPYCHGSGFEFLDDGGQGTCTTCRNGCYQKAVMNRRISFADIPESFKGMRLESFDTNVYETNNSRNKAVLVLKAINYWLNDFEAMKGRGMGLYLYSNAKGSGKTMAAVSIANELIYKKNIQVKFVTSLQILNEIKKSWDNPNREYTESKLLDFLSTTTVLIIDDFGTEQYKDWIGERFYHIINSRYVDKKITIFTSNARLESLKYDSRITNRIKERTFQIPFPEESVRDIIAKRNMEEIIEGIRKC